MKLLKHLLICFSLAIPTSSVLAADAAADGSITITSPADGAVLQSAMGNKVDFDVHLNTQGNHVHIYVDNQKPIVYQDVGRCPCSVDLPDLTPGKHTIAIKEATSSHALTGIQSIVTVTVK